jgi:hypothetical protein
MITVEVERVHEYDGAADRLWDVFTDPVRAASIDRRVTLVSSSGPPGDVGSSYEIDARSGLLRMRQHIEVLEAERPTFLKAATMMNGRVVAIQTTLIKPRSSGCQVTWTVTMESPRLVAGIARRKAERELPRWLEAAAVAAEQHS